jgi:proteasome accessory factor A
VLFQLSQRADFFEEEVGLETTVRRPIINTRDEPHCDPERWRRLHVITGDANMSENATFLKVGTTALILGLIEDNKFPDQLRVVDPVTEIRHVSHDSSLQHVVTCETGKKITAVDLQIELFKSTQKWFNTLDVDPTNGDGTEILTLWETVLNALTSQPENAAHIIDWVAKKRVIDGMMARYSENIPLERLRAIDLQYHDMNRERCLAYRMSLATRVTHDDARRAMTEPPVDTRAFFRGECIRKWPLDVSSANWDSMVFDIGQAVSPTPQHIRKVIASMV